MTSSPREYACYLVTNLVNGKRYVGVTGVGVQRRWNEHVWRAARKENYSRIAKAILKYGRDAFRVETIGRYAEAAEAKAAEVAFISEMKPEYNVTAGGDGSTGHVVSDEVREKLRVIQTGNKYNLGRKWTPEQRAKIIAAKTGVKLRPSSPEITARRSERIKKENERKKKKALCSDTGVIYSSVTDAAASNGMSISGVSSRCRTGLRSRAGLRFEFLEER